MSEIRKGVYSITIPVFDAKEYQYKYTLGKWSSVEVAANDSDISNRHFVSFNGKSITDTVIKWKQTKAVAKDSSEQLKRIVAMKDSLVAKLKPELGELIGLQKLYVENMLKEKPDMEEHNKLDEQAIQKIGNLYKGITHLFLDICASLSPEQKQQISKSINQPSNGDFLNSFFNAVNTAVK
jgi:hypothetical protein